MAKEQYRIVLSRGDAHVEIEGSEEFVEKHWGALQSLITDAPVPGEETERDELGETPGETHVSESPHSFGEHLNRFGNLKDVDKALVAGHFQQTKFSDDNLFTTGEVNQLLKEQGLKLSNPSQSVRQNLTGKKVFRESGKFRVSKQGEDHISELLANS